MTNEQDDNNPNVFDTPTSRRNFNRFLLGAGAALTTVGAIAKGERAGQIDAAQEAGIEPPSHPLDMKVTLPATNIRYDAGNAHIMMGTAMTASSLALSGIEGPKPGRREFLATVPAAIAAPVVGYYAAKKLSETSIDGKPSNWSVRETAREQESPQPIGRK